MKRTIYTEEHEIFRRSARQFVEREVVPNQESWRESGIVSREVWRKAGEAGFLCPWLPVEDGGVGGDLLYSLVFTEELARVYETDGEIRELLESSLSS